MTVQQPHWPSPQPNFGPRSSRSSLRIYSSGVAGSASRVFIRPFTFSVIMLISYLGFALPLRLRAIALALRAGSRFALPRGTRLRIPSRSIRLFFEMRARDEFLIEVRWIINDSRDDEPGIAIRLCGAIVMFRHNRLFAVRNAVLSEVSRAHPGRHNLQRTAGRRTAASPSAGHFP